MEAGLGGLARSDFGWPAETWRRYLVGRRALGSACEASKAGVATAKARALFGASSAATVALQDLLGRRFRPEAWPGALTVLLGWLSGH